jgi:hypothetical protein
MQYARYKAVIALFLCISTFILSSMTQTVALPTEPQPQPQWAPSEFPISFWCGPLEKFVTLERYREIKAAGFTHVMPPCGATSIELNRRILSLCAIVGLKAFIADPRMPMHIAGDANAREKLDAIVRDYRNYAALEGYVLTDEPGAAAFPGLAEVVAYLRQRDPRHYTYINLFPNYANAQQLGMTSYEEYVHGYQEQVQPFVLSYDHYHFLTSGDRPGFFNNLDVMRTASRESQVPFWQIVLAVQPGPYRNLTEGELRYEAMQTLAYGGQGLMWFTYWQPEDPSFKWSHALINLDGSHDPHYEMVSRVNHEVQAFGSQLLHADSRMVFQTGTLPPGGTPRPVNAPLDVEGQANLTIGIFDGDHRHTLALVTNQDYNHDADTTITSGGRSVALQQFDPATREWSRRRQTGALLLHLLPGGAALLRW